MSKRSEQLNGPLIQNIVLVWLDEKVNDNSSDDCKDAIKQFRSIINSVNVFNHVDQCIEFIKNIIDEKICLILSNSFGKDVVPRIHDLPPIASILIFSNEKISDQEWAKQWPKMKGWFSNVAAVCEHLFDILHQCERNCTSIGLSDHQNDFSKKSLKDFDYSFICGQILKDLLQTIQSKKRHFKQFIHYCEQIFASNDQQLNKIKEFEKNYHEKTPIYWYTYIDFFYPMLNRAVRLMDMNSMMKFWFFIDDLHRHIGKLYTEQFSKEKQPNKTFVVYRGQGMLNQQFEQLTKTKNGFLSFTNFLFTTKNRDICQNFALQAQQNPDYTAVLFAISVDPSKPAITPFALINNVGFYQYEYDEVLFSIHSIFRIESIQSINGETRLFQVNLKLIDSESEPKLRQLEDFIRKETYPNDKGWYRLGLVLFKFEQFHQAQQIFQVQLEQTADNQEKANIYNYLGLILTEERKYDQALEDFQKSIDLSQQINPPNQILLSELFSNIANIHYQMGQYTNALSFYSKSSDIQREIYPYDHPSILTCYLNIGLVLSKIGRYTEALSFYENALGIQQRLLPANHPLLATSYNNIGAIYDETNNYTKAFWFHEKALAIRQESLPPNHPEIALSFNNIGNVHQNMGDYTKALSFHEKAMNIREKALPSNHPDLAESYNNIGNIYFNLEQYSKALSLYQKVLAIRQQTLPSNHPLLGDIYNNIGAVYDKLEEYPQSLSYYDKALTIRQETLPANHPNLALSYSNIGVVYDKMGQYPQAIASYQKAIDIQKQALPANYPDLASSYNNIGAMYEDMKNYPQALSFYTEALSIRQQFLPPNHPDLGVSLNNIAEVYHYMKDYANALSFYQQGIQIQIQTLPPEHPDLALSFNKMAAVYETMGNYSQARTFYQRALAIAQRSLPQDHPHLLMYQQNFNDIQQKFQL